MPGSPAVSSAVSTRPLPCAMRKALLTSAFLTAGVGPWTPFQMIACGWVCLGAALLPPASGRAERWLLAGYGLVAGMLYGAAMNLWFWPFLGASAPPAARGRRSGGGSPATSSASPRARCRSCA